MTSISFTKVPYLFEFNGSEYSIEQLQQMYVKAKEPLESMRQQALEYADSTRKFCNSIDRTQSCVPYGSKAYQCRLVPNDPNYQEKQNQCEAMQNNAEELQNKYDKAQYYANSLKNAVDKSILTRDLASEERRRQIIEYEEISSTFKTIQEKPTESAISIASSLIPLGIIALIGLRGKK